MSHGMIRFFALFCLLFVTAGPLATAQSASPVLVELFASQNCAACPKAHRTLQSVAKENDDVLILTWSVDYWDYLGQADPMAMPEAKARQAAYAEHMGLRAPYTPQSVYDGAKQCPATRRKTVEKNLEARRKAKAKQPAMLIQTGEIIEVKDACATDLDVILVEYLPDEAHETTMVNPVISKQVLGRCTPDTKSFTATCQRQCAVLLQKPDHGEVLAALALN